MDILTNLAIFVASLGVLLKASDWFVDSAETIGLSFGISPFIIGVTIIAFGTSLPELATSIAAVLSDNPQASEMVVSNVIGSNITNIALVLGLTAVFVNNIKLRTNIWEIDMPFLWASALLLWLVLQDMHISTFECILFLLGIVIFLTYSFKKGNKADKSERPKSSVKHYFLLVLGGVLVWLSADYTIYAILNISESMGIAPKLISLSAVALGTSLPEIAVSLTAAKRGKASIAVGNVLGSNIFNTFFVMAIPGLLGNLIIPPDILSFFLPLMIVMTLLFGIMFMDRRLSRIEGAILLLFYLLFMGEILS